MCGIEHEKAGKERRKEWSGVEGVEHEKGEENGEEWREWKKK